MKQKVYIIDGHPSINEWNIQKYVTDKQSGSYFYSIREFKHTTHITIYY